MLRVLKEKGGERMKLRKRTVTLISIVVVAFFLLGTAVVVAHACMMGAL